MSEMSKISAFSALQIPGQAKARLPQDTHLTYSFFPGWLQTVPDNTSFDQFCYWESIFLLIQGENKMLCPQFPDGS